MWAAIAGIIQIIAMILKTKLERDSEERKRKDELLTGWTQVVKSRDPDRINDFLDKLRT